MTITGSGHRTYQSLNGALGAIFVLCSLLVAMGHAGALPDCPATPNCVSSQASQSERQVAPLQAGSHAIEAVERLTLVLDSLPRVSWQQQSDSIITAEFTSRLFRFVDDVLFHIGEDGVVQIRSASRVGRSDFGVNRARVEMLQDRLDALATD